MSEHFPSASPRDWRGHQPLAVLLALVLAGCSAPVAAAESPRSQGRAPVTSRPSPNLRLRTAPASVRSAHEELQPGSKPALRQAADDQLPPLPEARFSTGQPSTDHSALEVGTDGFPPLRGHVPGRSSTTRVDVRPPDRGARDDFAGFGRQILPQISVDGFLPAPRLLPCHRPLYFEDALLERHGVQGPECLQPGLSAAHFYGSLAIIPFKLIHRPPCAHVETSDLSGESGVPTCLENLVGDLEPCDD